MCSLGIKKEHLEVSIMKYAEINTPAYTFPFNLLLEYLLLPLF